MLLQQPPQGIGARRHPLPADPVQTDQGVVSKNTNELVLPPLNMGEMTLRLYGALNYSRNSVRDLRCALNGA